jgi:hypothetical protein
VSDDEDDGPSHIGRGLPPEAPVRGPARKVAPPAAERPVGEHPAASEAAASSETPASPKGEGAADRTQAPAARESNGTAAPTPPPAQTPPAQTPPAQQPSSETPPVQSPPSGPPRERSGGRNGGRALYIIFRRTGDSDRDKFRLKEIYDMVRDPRGRDHFFIRIIENGHTAELSFPNDPCTITDRLVGDLRRHLKLDVTVE